MDTKAIEKFITEDIDGRLWFTDLLERCEQGRFGPAAERFFEDIKYIARAEGYDEGQGDGWKAREEAYNV